MTTLLSGTVCHPSGTYYDQHAY